MLRASLRSDRPPQVPPGGVAKPAASGPLSDPLVVRVLPDVPAIDKTFDYLVPEKYADTAVPGARVKVRFAGQDVDNTAVLVAYTRYGDADMNGIVNLNDFNRLTAGFGSPGAWTTSPRWLCKRSCGPNVA